MGFVKLARIELYTFYCDPYAKFEDSTFDNFHSIEALTNETYPCTLNDFIRFWVNSLFPKGANGDVVNSLP